MCKRSDREPIELSPFATQLTGNRHARKRSSQFNEFSLVQVVKETGFQRVTLCAGVDQKSFGSPISHRSDKIRSTFVEKLHGDSLTEIYRICGHRFQKSDPARVEIDLHAACAQHVHADDAINLLVRRLTDFAQAQGHDRSSGRQSAAPQPGIGPFEFFDACGTGRRFQRAGPAWSPKMLFQAFVDPPGNRSIALSSSSCSLTASGPCIGPHSGRIANPLRKSCATSMRSSGQCASMLARSIAISSCTTNRLRSKIGCSRRKIWSRKCRPAGYRARRTDRPPHPAPR